MNGVILCAGEGERLRPLTLTTPKPLLPIGGRPLIERTIVWLRRYGVRKLFINLHHLGRMIEAHLGDGRRFGVHINYSHEEELLGTAGALRPFTSLLNEPFVLIYGDIVTEIDLSALADYHRRKGGIATIVVQRTDRPQDCDIVEVDREMLVTAFHRAPGSLSYGTLGNAALYLLEPEIIRYLPDEGPADFVADLFPLALAAGEEIYAYESTQELLDIGTKERYEQAQRRYR